MTVPADLSIEGPRPLRGRLRVPGDKGISHRALLFASLADGVSTLRHLADGDDVARTTAALRAVGVPILVGEIDDGTILVTAAGVDALREADDVLDCANSGTTIRMLCGLLAGRPFHSVLSGDASLRRRPMQRVAIPLRDMGARVDGRDDARFPPLSVRGGALTGIRAELTVASAQVKTALVLAGLQAAGATEIHEPTPSRDHTERMLAALGAPIERTGPTSVRVEAGAPDPFELDVPGDPSSAAFFVVAAVVTAGSELTVEGVDLNPTRLGFVDVLRRMGADVEVHPHEERLGEPVGDLVARAGPLTGTVVGGDEIPNVQDEVPVLAVAAAFADGVTEFRDVAELRVKESDRVATVAAALTGLGVGVETGPDRLVVRGGRPGPVTWDSHGDHRVAMAGAVAANAVDGASTVRGWTAVTSSYPRFADDLEGVHPVSTVVAIDGPSGAGKSTVARRVAAELGLEVLDTGAMYRAVTLAVLDAGIDPTDADGCAAIAGRARIEQLGPRTLLEGRDVSAEIRSPRVDATVSTVSAHPEVRRVLVEHQRSWVDGHHGGVVEGRDIGTVVFPDAVVKVFLTASEEERARRRRDEVDAGATVSVEAVREDLGRRDRLDSTRAASPLVAAADALRIDTTGREVDDVVREIVERVRAGTGASR